MGSVGACTESRPGPPPQSWGSTFNRSVPASVLDLPLTTGSGARTDLAAYRGKVVVLADFLTLCQEVCPMTSANFEQMVQAVDKTKQAHKVIFLEITVDPQRDVPARLAAYRKLFAPATNWILATGTPADLARLWKFFGVFYQRQPEGSPPAVDWWTREPLTYDIAHDDSVIFLDASGHERFLILGDPDTRGAAPPKTLVDFLDAQGRSILASPSRTAWTSTEGLHIVSWLLGHRIG